MRKKLPYSVGVIAIVCLIVSVLAVVIMGVCLYSTNQALEEKIIGIEGVIEGAIQEVDGEELSMASLEAEIEELENRHDLFLNNLTIILSVFAFLVTICTVLLPLYTYNFLQKDQIENFHTKTSQMVEEAKQKSDETVLDLNREQNQLKAEIRKQIESLQMTEANFKNWLEKMFSPFDFSEIRIEPIYNITETEVEDYYRKAFVEFGFGRNESALKILNSILQLQPKNNKALILKAQVFYALEKYDMSIDVLNTLIYYYGDFNYYFDRGCVKFKAKYYDSALSDFKFVYDKDPKNEENLLKLAATLHKMYRTSEAITFQSLAIELNADMAQYYADRGIMYHALKQYDRALSDKNRALTLSPDNAQYRGIYSATLCKAKNYIEAIKYADMALNKDDTLAFVYSFRGLSKAKLPNLYSKDDALEDLSRAVELDPHNHRNYNRRAEFYIMYGDTISANQDLDSAYNLAPLDPEIMHLYCLMYQSIGDDTSEKEYQIKAMQLGYISEP